MVILGVLLTGVIGCAVAGRSAPSRFYILSPLPPSGNGTQTPVDARRITVGIGPVEIPPYLDRPQIVTRIGRNELALAEFDKWSESLKDNVSRVLVENLGNLLSADAVSIVPWRGPIAIDYHVQIDVLRMDGVLGGNATLMARWTVLEKDGRPVRSTRKSIFEEPTGLGDYRALVSALSRTIASLSEEIAKELKALYG